MTELERELDRILTRLAALPERHQVHGADLTHTAAQRIRDLTPDTQAPRVVPRIGTHAAGAQLRVICAEFAYSGGHETEAAQILADLRRALP
ncbi:MAG: hypothetical protein FJW97_02855 [Actinobacteria bacterium]|nr:hypothetical protein [Actinomycetota bacterium]